MDEQRHAALLRCLDAGIVALAACLLLALASPRADAQSAPRIYACKDARGRTLSSDRPIADCADREQAELRKSGGVLRTIDAAASPMDLAARERRDEEAEQAALLRSGERRRERALLVRYPDARIHDQERAEALAQIDQTTRVANDYLAALKVDRQRLDGELEFYRGDRALAPAVLRRKFDENEAAVRAQLRFIRQAEDDRQRLALRFAKERAQLEPLWRTSSQGIDLPRSARHRPLQGRRCLARDLPQ
ncbi:DUF4124 domain-containing protein [Variovorax sp. GT1P44]|uniref:DUF4124 domain-containing protein n=1 Tax=Variovorax sp. GT1P44 TaxID=3443742 RepID=UPI003F47562C